MIRFFLNLLIIESMRQKVLTGHVVFSTPMCIISNIFMSIKILFQYIESSFHLTLPIITTFSNGSFLLFSVLNVHIMDDNYGFSIFLVSNIAKSTSTYLRNIINNNNKFAKKGDNGNLFFLVQN